MNKAIELALLDREILNDKTHWASFECSEAEIRVEVGTVHSDGTKEIKIVTRKYYEVGGRVQVAIEVHT